MRTVSMGDLFMRKLSYRMIRFIDPEPDWTVILVLDWMGTGNELLSAISQHSRWRGRLASMIGERVDPTTWRVRLQRLTTPDPTPDHPLIPALR